jgi:serine/threonine protein kinase
MSSMLPGDDRTMLPPMQAGGADGVSAAPAADDDGALPPGTRIAEFEIIRVIGVGGFGIVYLAYDHNLDCEVALKEYMPSSLAARNSLNYVTLKSGRHAETFQAGMRSFINEARLLAHFEHPSLVKVKSFREANDTAYMAMQYYQGQTLKQALQQMGAPPGEAWLNRLLAALLDALELLHGEQCFHRDIAPDNILMLASGQPVLLDFGAARRTIGDAAQRFTVILKPGYAPIEQYAECSAMRQGPWTDIYALASVVHFAITGSAPIASVSRMVLDQQVPLAQRAAGRYSKGFLEAMDRGLAVEPGRRPQSIAELRALLQLPARAGDDGSTVQSPPRPGDPTQSAPDKVGARPGRHGVVAAAAACLVLALGAGLFLLRDHVAERWSDAPPAPSTPAPSPRDQPIQPATIPPAPPANLPNEAAAQKPAGPAELLARVFNNRDVAHQVTVNVEKPQVVIGRDPLRFSLTSAKGGYVYLLSVGTDNQQFWMLFPNSLDQSNRISAGKTMTLPRSSWQMDASGPPGTDRFVVMVSASRRDFSAAGARRDGPFMSFTGRPAAANAAVVPGSIPLHAGTPVCPDRPAESCSPLYGAEMFEIQELPAR